MKTNGCGMEEVLSGRTGPLHTDFLLDIVSLTDVKLGRSLYLASSRDVRYAVSQQIFRLRRLFYARTLQLPTCITEQWHHASRAGD